MSLRARLLPGLCLALFVTIGCGGEPPDKEMQQAQGALDAARAAGADKYATEEFAAATLALTNAKEAVDQRDYRLALNHALDSRERAQAAAREAVDRKAALRITADSVIAAATEAIARADARLKAMDARSSRAAQLRTAVDHAKAQLQEARTAMDAEAFAKAETSARAALAALTPVSGAPESAGSKPSAPRPR